ncbi:Protein CBG27519 [Caenorhabditis briggsae]|uniref:Protein CBG27519 n=1 Tax=Caenorhabditis briggsae TaxID=6238 RepID=B6IKI0_CAEBR|nr:Protein CBG27519 [Caenorhabditis briggsae]CAS00410.1 Protein CBG27519 [Caenorhabditis briggsae]
MGHFKNYTTLYDTKLQIGIRRFKECLNVREILVVASIFAIGNYLLPTPTIEEHPTEHKCSVIQYRTAANITRPSWKALLMTHKPEIQVDSVENDSGRTKNYPLLNSQKVNAAYSDVVGFKTYPPRKIAQECPGCTTLDSEEAGRTTNYPLLNSQKVNAAYSDAVGFKTYPPRKIAQECPGCTTLDSEEAGRTTNYPLLNSQKTTAAYTGVVEFKTHPPRKNEADSSHPPRKAHDESRDDRLQASLENRNPNRERRATRIPITPR